MKFVATVELHGKTATGIEVPPEVVEALGSGKRVPVQVAIGPHTYRTTVTPMGGRFLIPLSAENRTGAGVSAGEQVEVSLWLDVAPREVEVPDDLAAALDAAGVRAAFDALAFTYRKEYARSVLEAKAPATRERRIIKVIDTLCPAG